jgi:two-component system response regulator CpxR
MIDNVESPALKGMKRPLRCPVLIVEDDADLREMMAQLLTLEGFETATAANGQEALEYLHATATPEVILLDLMMPIMDGWVRPLQASPSSCSLRSISRAPHRLMLPRS